MSGKSNQKMVENAMFLAWAIAVVATLGSLYFSEIKFYIPCELCWIQRIFMYPLAITLAIASVKKDAKHAIYALPLSLIGMSFSIYHYMLEKIPALSTRAEACGIIPCNYEYINWVGFITIPFLALIAFFLISVILIFVIKASKE